MKKLILILLIIGSFIPCTDNSITKTFGGTTVFETQKDSTNEITNGKELPKNEVILNVTWKEDNLWILTRDTITKVTYFRERSAFGIFEGEIIFK